MVFFDEVSNGDITTSNSHKIIAQTLHKIECS